MSPVTHSAQKALRQSEKRRKRNIIRKAQMKKPIKEIEKFLLLGKKEEALKLAPQAYKAIDKAVKTGILKKNTASRKKSRLIKLINKTSQ